MTTVSRTIRTDKNVWTFDVSIDGDKNRNARILRVFGDVTNEKALMEAADKCLSEFNTEEE